MTMWPLRISPLTASGHVESQKWGHFPLRPPEMAVVRQISLCEHRLGYSNVHRRLLCAKLCAGRWEHRGGHPSPWTALPRPGSKRSQQNKVNAERGNHRVRLWEQLRDTSSSRGQGGLHRGGDAWAEFSKVHGRGGIPGTGGACTSMSLGGAECVCVSETQRLGRSPRTRYQLSCLALSLLCLPRTPHLGSGNLASPPVSIP